MTAGRDASPPIAGDDPVAARDRWFPPRGPCGLCGHPDARHRLWDAIRGRVAAGESPVALADDYDLPAAAVVLVLARPDLTAG